MAKGGDVFLLDMGQPIKIRDLVLRMIELSGLTVKDELRPQGDIEIEISGLRPGEKLYEELLIGGNPKPTSHSQIMKAHEEFVPWAELEATLNTLEIALGVNDAQAVCAILTSLVPKFILSSGIVDWIHLEEETQYKS